MGEDRTQLRDRLLALIPDLSVKAKELTGKGRLVEKAHYMSAARELAKAGQYKRMEIHSVNMGGMETKIMVYSLGIGEDKFTVPLEPALFYMDRITYPIRTLSIASIITFESLEITGKEVII